MLHQSKKTLNSLEATLLDKTKRLNVPP
jgi:hypothetical protein